jgi:hypothetical protein
VEQPDVLQRLLQAAFAAADEGRNRGSARRGRALEVVGRAGSTGSTWRRQLDILVFVVTIIPRGPRGAVDKDGR